MNINVQPPSIHISGVAEALETMTKGEEARRRKIAETKSHIEARQYEALELKHKAEDWNAGYEQKEVVLALSLLLHEQCRTNLLLMQLVEKLG